MAKIDLVSRELINKYEDDITAQGKKPGFVYVQNGEGSFSLKSSIFKQLINKARKTRKKGFYLVSFEPVKSDSIPSYYYNIDVDNDVKKPEEKLWYHDISGMFKLMFSDGSFLYYAKWIASIGKNREWESLFAGEKEVWLKFIKYLRTSVKYKKKPKNGIFKIDMVQMPNGNKELVYYPKKDLNETPIIHPEIEKVDNDLEFFFDNLPLFTRFKMPGTRKVILVGEPGSGKSSYCYKLANNKKSIKSIVFSTNISALAQHLFKCAHYNVSTICILEDAESTLEKGDASILNFLDGIDQPTNKKGAYIIMTTNFPKRIEARILKRPGRIDKIFKFDALKDDDAINCAKIYLEGFLNDDERKEMFAEKNADKLHDLFNKMTGAQIKNLIDSSISYASSNQKDLNLETIITAKQLMNKDLKDVYDYAEVLSLDESRSIGFRIEREEETEAQIAATSK